MAENVGLILDIFFLILGGLILGLTLLVANLRGFIEIVMTYLLLFWERKSMRTLVKKNLVAHKNTNKLTSVIYAMTLGCVIFLCVALNLVIKSTQSFSSESEGSLPANADIDLIGFFPVTGNLDKILVKYAPNIKSFAFVTQPLN